MKLSRLALLTAALTACGDDGPGLTEGGSESSSSSGATSTGSGSDSADTTEGAETTEGEPVDPRPILEREPLTTYSCEETRAMTSAVGATFGRSEALVALGGEYSLLRSTDVLSLANIALDGTIGDEVVLEPEGFGFRDATSIVVDGRIATVWWATGGVLRYAVVDDALGLVVAPKEITGTTELLVTPAAMLPSGSGGIALIYGESDEAGQTQLRFLVLDADGETVGSPVDIADVGQIYAAVSATAAATSDGGYAVAYAVGQYDESEVFFVILEADGTQRFTPQRISREAVDGWRAELPGAPRSSLLPVGDRFWLAFTESWFDPDPMSPEGNAVIKLAVVDAEGGSEQHVLEAPVDGQNSLWPSFLALDDRVGLMWTTGTIIWICVGCISNHDLHFVLLDPDAIVPASNVVTQLHQRNGIVGPLGAFVGPDMLTAASLDFHAVSLPASGSLRCEPTG